MDPSSVTVLPYDPAWPGLAAAVADEVRTALGPDVTAIAHIGSTSVPGLAAKPVLDLMAATPDLDRVRDGEGRLTGLGYRRVETGMSGRLFYRRQPGPSLAVHLHVVPVDGWDLRNERLLRYHLGRHPDLADRYGALKARLAADGANGDEYTRAKTALVQEIVDAARRERGLEPVDVWET